MQGSVALEFWPDDSGISVLARAVYTHTVDSYCPNTLGELGDTGDGCAAFAAIYTKLCVYFRHTLLFIRH